MAWRVRWRQPAVRHDADRLQDCNQAPGRSRDREHAKPWRFVRRGYVRLRKNMPAVLRLTERKKAQQKRSKAEGSTSETGSDALFTLRFFQINGWFLHKFEHCYVTRKN